MRRRLDAEEPKAIIHDTLERIGDITKVADTKLGEMIRDFESGRVGVLGSGEQRHEEIAYASSLHLCAAALFALTRALDMASRTIEQ